MRVPYSCFLRRLYRADDIVLYLVMMIAWTFNAIITTQIGQSYQVRAADWCHLLTIVPKSRTVQLKRQVASPTLKHQATSPVLRRQAVSLTLRHQSSRLVLRHQSSKPALKSQAASLVLRHQAWLTTHARNSEDLTGLICRSRRSSRLGLSIPSGIMEERKLLTFGARRSLSWFRRSDSR